MADQPRDYQARSLELIREKFQAGHRKILLWLATGAGKTFVFCIMVKAAVARGNKAIILVRGRKLVDQASARLLREHVPHGVLMRGHWNYNPSAPVQVCSIDTLLSRKIFPDADLIIIDEADMATSDGFKRFLQNPKYQQAYMVPVTATPWVDDGLRHIADDVVHPITMEELIENKYLAPFRYFAPSKPDLTKVKVSAATHDYDSGQLENAMVSGQLTGKIIDHWLQHAENRPTICFAVNIKHSKLLAAKFNEAGIKAEHCDADSKDGERNEVIKRVEAGTTKVICNVGIFGRGVDVPCVSCIVMARPTKSRNLFIQQAGRGTRLFAGKENCLLLDHAGNTDEHGLPVDEPEVYLDGTPKKESKPKEFKVCPDCFCCFRGKVCPECGAEAPERIADIAESDEKLIEITAKDIDPIKKKYKELCREQKQTGKKKGWVYYQLIKFFPMEDCLDYLPGWFIEKQNNPMGGFFGSGLSRFGSPTTNAFNKGMKR